MSAAGNSGAAAGDEALGFKACHSPMSADSSLPAGLQFGEPGATCADCSAFLSYGERGNRGECRRRAPVRGETSIDDGWPITFGNSWCAEIVSPRVRPADQGRG